MDKKLQLQKCGHTNKAIRTIRSKKPESLQIHSLYVLVEYCHNFAESVYVCSRYVCVVCMYY